MTRRRIEPDVQAWTPEPSDDRHAGWPQSLDRAIAAAAVDAWHDSLWHWPADPSVILTCDDCGADTLRWKLTAPDVPHQVLCRACANRNVEARPPAAQAEARRIQQQKSERKRSLAGEGWPMNRRWYRRQAALRKELTSPLVHSSIQAWVDDDRQPHRGEDAAKECHHEGSIDA
jgi:hypothetical protein